MSKVKKADPLQKQFPVVGIGASAGGLDAVKIFLKALPAKTGMAFVFIQHLSPTHESILPEILRKIAPFPVNEITDNIHLDPDNLYIIPENKVVTVIDHMLRLEPLTKQNKKNTIDLFFSSLGIIHQSYAIGVVLSGALHDGTQGLQVIKSYGGLTFAQDEGSAAFESMPKSAAKAGVVDFILPPDKIAERIISINDHFHADHSPAENLPSALPQPDNEVFKQILTVLRVRRGVDFNYYKQSTLKRRIIRRMAFSKTDKLVNYLAFLRESKAEQDALYNDMLISVTHFFRDIKSFDVLCTTIFPELVDKKEYDDPLRIWVAGCASGEEAYSMAICLQEHLGDKAAAMRIQIFATDISETAIAKARTGVYRPAEVEGMSPSRLQQFFTKVDGNYQVNKIIRDMCVFAHHNLLKDPPFSKIDLVSCRNVLIYLEPVLQKRALTTFNYSLNHGGYLMLGKSETIGSSTDIFTPYNSTEKIYHRKGAVGRFMTVSSAGRERSFREIDQGVQQESINRDIFKLADDVMLANFMPPAVLVNEKFDVVQFRGSTDTWLVPPTGKPSYNVLKMAREGLGFELRNLLHSAQKTTGAVRKFAVFFKINNLQQYVNMQVIRITEYADPHYLVIFQQTNSKGIKPNMFETSIPGEVISHNAAELRVDQLERELVQNRADIRIISEEQETANEELQSANEELLSGSEELQSLNEELETSKEELQSTNEEIMIVNKELIDRNDQLNNTRLYADGIISTIRDPLVILDKELRVKRATSGFYNKFKLTEEEAEGKYIYEIKNNQWDIPALRKLLDDVLPAKKALADIEIIQAFSGIGKKILCINAREIDNINGEKLILLALEDLTDKRKIEEGLAEVERLLAESKERLKFAVDSAGLGTWDYNPQTKAIAWDKRCREIFGITQSAVFDMEVFLATINADDRLRVKNSIRDTLNDKDSGEFDLEFRTAPIKGKIKWLKAKGRAYFNEDGIAVRFIGTLLDITVQRLLDEATSDLLNKKDEFISIASHELKTPITSLKAVLQMIERLISQKEEMKQVTAFVKKGIRQVDKLADLIKDLLEVTKIQAGKLDLKMTTFILNEVIENCCEDSLILSENHKIVIEGEKEVAVYADHNRLEQVVINLISNAIKYSPGADKVIVKVTKLDDGIKVAVTDFGIGISPETLPFLFDRFYRVDDISQRYSGLGLGLYISAEIVKRHHGDIGIDSTPGKGSTFWFTIPNAK